MNATETTLIRFDGMHDGLRSAIERAARARLVPGDEMYHLHLSKPEMADALGCVYVRGDGAVCGTDGVVLHTEMLDPIDVEPLDVGDGLAFFVFARGLVRADAGVAFPDVESVRRQATIKPVAVFDVSPGPAYGNVRAMLMSAAGYDADEDGDVFAWLTLWADGRDTATVVQVVSTADEDADAQGLAVRYALAVPWMPARRDAPTDWKAALDTARLGQAVWWHVQGRDRDFLPRFTYAEGTGDGLFRLESEGRETIIMPCRMPADVAACAARIIDATKQEQTA